MYTIIRYIIFFVFKIYYNITLEGLENVPKEGGYIYASNHRSYTDPVIISLGVRKRFCYMAKKELFQKNIFFTALIKLMGAFPVERGKNNTQAIDTSIEKLKNGRNLVIFPEGTRSYDGKVGSGKTGVAMIAAHAGRDVIPVGIIFEGPKLKFRSKIIVRYGKRISAEELSFGKDASISELKVLREKIMDSIRELVEGKKEDV